MSDVSSQNIFEVKIEDLDEEMLDVPVMAAMLPENTHEENIKKERALHDSIKYVRPFSEYKRQKCLLFERGIEILKGTGSLVGYDGQIMNLVAQEEPLAWDDSKRNGSYGADACADVCPANANDIKKGCSREGMKKNQALGFSVNDTRFDARVVSVEARCLYVTIGVGKKSIKLYSPEYFEEWSKAFRLAGGSIKGTGDLIDMDTVLDDNGHVWIDVDAKMWALIHSKEGLTPNTLIPVYVRFYLARAGDPFVIMKNFYGHSAFEISSTSSGLFGMSYADRCYSAHNEMIKDCTGVWNKNKVTGTLEMASILLGASSARFDTKGIESMKTKEDNIRSEIKELPTSTGEDMEIKDEKALPPPSSGLFPVVGNLTKKGTFFTTLTTPIRDRIKIRSGFATSKGGATRGGGGRKRYSPSPSPEPEDDIDENDNEDIKTDISFATIGVGEALYPVTGMPVFDLSKQRLGVPTMAIMCLLVTDEDDDEHKKTLTSKQIDEKAIQLVEAVAQQVRDIDEMFVESAQAVISGIQCSAHCLKKTDMNEQELVSLEATKAINKNMDFFGI